MKRWIGLVIIGLGLIGCSQNVQEKEGSVVKFGSDSFVVKYDEHQVVKSEFIRPVSVVDQINPRWRITLENNQTFSSPRSYNLEEKIVFKTYVRLR